MLLKCTCKHEYQDKKYGKDLRVHNPKIAKTGDPGDWRCSVCGKTRNK